MTTSESTPHHVHDLLPGAAFREYGGQFRVEISPDELLVVLTKLKQAGFDLLVDITCVDYLHYRGATNRFGLAYLLANTQTAERMTVRAMLDEPDLKIASVVPLWEGANWLEREVFDMFGIEFDGHPNLIRILLPQEFTAHPLRKDYPLQGRGERHNFPTITRGEA